MKIIRILNNNVVQAQDDDGREVILMGKGIAFMGHGGKIDSTKIEKVFTLNKNEFNAQMNEMFRQIPEEFWDFGTRVVNYIEQNLDISLSAAFYVALVDHIYVSVERYKQDIQIPDIFSAETRYVFPEIYKVSLEVVGMMNDEFGYEFSESEAGFIALHIIDAESDLSHVRDNTITVLTQDILKIVEKRFGVYPTNETINGTRFLIHLKYLANKIFLHEKIDNNELYAAIFNNLVRDFPNHYAAVLEIVYVVQNKYQYDISRDEQCYLLIHLIKITE